MSMMSVQDVPFLKRETRIQSEFSPPPFVKSIPLRSKRPNLDAAPWFPEMSREAAPAPVEKKSKPQPLLPPTGLGTSPDLKPTRPSIIPPLLPDLGSASPTNSLSTPFSPLSTPICAFSNTFTSEAEQSRVYSVDMFRSVRHVASHTPHGVLQWCLRQYSENPILKTPNHLQLSLNEIISAKDGAVRGTFGLSVKGKIRRQTVKQTHHKVLSVLSRLTLEKYTPLLQELQSLPLRQCDEGELQQVVNVFFDKAVNEPKFSDLYAKIVSEICTMSEKDKELDPELKERLLSTRMQRMLVNTCGVRFAKPIELTEDDKVDRTTGKPFDEEEVGFKRRRLKDALVGNVKFVGELYKLDLVTNRVIEDILNLLVGSYNPDKPMEKEEYVFECFQTLIITIGSELYQRTPHVLTRFLGIANTIQKTHPKNRVQFLMMNLSDLNKKKGWVRDNLVNASSRFSSTQDLSASDVSPKILRPTPVYSNEHSNDTSSSPTQQQQQQRDLSSPKDSGSLRPIGGLHSHPNSNSNTNSSGNTANQPRNSSVSIPKPRNSLGGPQNQSNPDLQSGSFMKSSPGNKNAPSPTAGKGNNNNNTYKPGNFNSETNAPPKGKELLRTPTSREQQAPPPPAFSPSQLTPTRPAAYASPLSTSSLLHSFPSSDFPTPVRNNPNLSEIVDMESVARQMMELYHKGLHAHLKEERTTKINNVLRCITEMELRNKVLCVTWWLRMVTTSASLHEERQEIPYLFDDILEKIPEMKRIFQEAVLEWIKFDIENAQYERCPRFFDNVAQLVACCQSSAQLHSSVVKSTKEHPHPKGSKLNTPVWELTHIRDVQDIFPFGVFNLMLYTLTSAGGTDQIITLLKSVQPSYHSLFQGPPPNARQPKSTGEDSPLQDLRRAALHRVRLLPYCLSVSTIQTNGEYFIQTPTDTPKHRSSNNSPLLRSSPLGDSVTSTHHYDPLAQALVFPKVSEDVELTVFRKVRTAAQERLQGNDSNGNDWMEEVVRLATNIPGGVFDSRVVIMMKVVGALLTCSSITLQKCSDGETEAKTEMISPADLDLILGKIQSHYENSSEQQKVISAAIVIELLNHHTLRVANAPPFRKSDKVRHIRSTFARWCRNNIMKREDVVEVLSQFTASPNDADSFAFYHNSLVSVEMPWATAVSFL